MIVVMAVTMMLMIHTGGRGTSDIDDGGDNGADDHDYVRASCTNVGKLIEITDGIP